MGHDERQEPADDVRTVRLPATVGPHYRNLALAAAALLLLVGLLVFVTPMKKGQSETRPAPTRPEKTFLDEPPAEPAEPEEEATSTEPWWRRFAGPPAPAEASPPGEDAFRAWPAGAPGDVSADPLPALPDPRQESLARALKSSTLKRAASQPVGPGRTADTTAMDPMLAAAARALPSPEAVAAMLSAATRPPGVSSPPASAFAAPAFPTATDPSLAMLAGAIPAPAPSGHAPSLGPPPSLAPAAPFFAARALPGSHRRLRAGTLILARLETAIDSDAPGPVAARVLRDVTDSATGQEVLIPAGALLLGSVGQQLATGRNRALVAFERLLWPGISYEIPGFEALETTGTRGLSDQVDHHTFSLLGRAVLLAAVGAGFEIAQPDRGAGESLRAGDLAAARMALELDRVAARILERGLDRPPTVKVRSGERFYVYLHRDLEL